jgi:hypothetical protein
MATSPKNLFSCQTIFILSSKFVIKYNCVTHVGAFIGVLCFKEPTRNGLTFSKVKGLNTEAIKDLNFRIQQLERL